MEKASGESAELFEGDCGIDWSQTAHRFSRAGEGADHFCVSIVSIQYSVAERIGIGLVTEY